MEPGGQNLEPEDHGLTRARSRRTGLRRDDCVCPWWDVRVLRGPSPARGGYTRAQRHNPAAPRGQATVQPGPLPFYHPACLGAVFNLPSSRTGKKRVLFVRSLATVSMVWRVLCHSTC
jgi:hypothetical protein